MNYKLRECTLNDLDFILKLKELGMKWYIEKIYGWDASVQKQKTLKELQNNLGNMKIIVGERRDASVTTFIEADNYFQVGLTIILPQYQNKGLATSIISEYIIIAKRKKKRIIIRTYKENPAQNLYKRLGFNIYKTDDTHIYLDINFN